MRTCIKQKEGDLTLKCSGECGQEKPATIEYFYWRTDLKIWRRKCRICMREVKREATNRFRSKNKEKVKEYVRRSSNKPEFKLKQKLNGRKRRKNEEYRLRSNISRKINYQLHKLGFSKNGLSTLEGLPYTMEQLKQHLESQFEPWMNWDNYGKYYYNKWDDNNSSTWVWQIDHIIPCSTLPYTSMEDENFKKCWALENLRPLSAKQNILDGVTRVRHKLSPEAQT